MPFKRFATKDQLNTAINWRDNAAAIRAFRDRIIGWYLEPIADWPRTGHEAFIALLAVRQVIVTAATALYGESHAEQWKEIILEVDEDFRKVGKVDSATYAQRFLESVFSMTWGELRMTKMEGISGTGKLAVENEEGVLVFDPWVVRDRVREWFERKFAGLEATPGGPYTVEVCGRLREAFLDPEG